MKKSRHIHCQTANEAFVKLADWIYRRPEFVVSPRGELTREVLCVGITIAVPYQRCVTHPYRGFSLKYALGEWLWYRRPSNKLNEIRYYSKFWDKVSDDSKTINSAYGCRIFGKHPRVKLNQWNFVKRELARDSSSRRAVMLILGTFDLSHTTRDLPCTSYLQFFIREGRLHLSVNMRSNDLVLGFANDLFAFTLFQEQMLCELRKTYPKLRMGEYHHFAGSMHIYERNLEMIKSVLREPDLSVDFQLPRMRNIDEIDRLEKVEESLRRGKASRIILTDPFCIYCKEQLST